MVLANLDVGLLYILGLSSLGVLSVFMAGYSSNNKYSLFGAMRVIAMLVSLRDPDRRRRCSASCSSRAR